jgi:exopolysaccharide production protein ExoQ
MSAAPVETGMAFRRWPIQTSTASANWIGWIFVAFTVTIYTGAMTSSVRFYRGDQQLLPGTTDWINVAPQLVILLGVLLFIIRRWREIVPLLQPLLPYLMVLVLCGLSATWSPYPVVTVRRASSLSICVGFGIYCYIVFGLEDTIRMVGRTIFILSILSVITYVAIPSVGYEVAEGYSSAMRGVFSQKNNLGASMALGISCYLCPVAQRGGSRAGAWAAILIMLGCIVMSQSATSLLVALLTIVTALGLAMGRLVPTQVTVVAIGAVLLLAVFIIVFVPDLPLAVIGRDSSLNGRLPLWELSFQAAEDRPWFGYGYYAFWNENARWAEYIWQVIGWPAPSAHNGYLEVVLEIGLVGLAFYAWIWLRVTALAIAALLRSQLPVASWILCYMVIICVLNLDEGTLPYPDQFAVLMPGIICTLEAWRSQYRREQWRIRRRNGLNRDIVINPDLIPWGSDKAAQPGHKIVPAAGRLS